ncbi:hypothetical protein D9M73_267010 [compost metagenome]
MIVSAAIAAAFSSTFIVTSTGGRLVAVSLSCWMAFGRMVTSTGGRLVQLFSPS